MIHYYYIIAIDNEDDSESDSRDISIVSGITGETSFVAPSPVYKIVHHINELL